jgi:hypothetical protein
MVASALQPAWRGSPRADGGEKRLVGCAGKLPAFCRPARPRARPVSRAAAYGATLPLRRQRAAETRRQTPSPAPPTLHRARSARPVSGPSLGASDPAPLLCALGGAPSAVSLGAGCPGVQLNAAAPTRASAGMAKPYRRSLTALRSLTETLYRLSRAPV